MSTSVLGSTEMSPVCVIQKTMLPCNRAGSLSIYISGSEVGFSHWNRAAGREIVVPVCQSLYGRLALWGRHQQHTGIKKTPASLFMFIVSRIAVVMFNSGLLHVYLILCSQKRNDISS